MESVAVTVDVPVRDAACELLPVGVWVNICVPEDDTEYEGSCVIVWDADCEPLGVAYCVRDEVRVVL